MVPTSTTIGATAWLSRKSPVCVRRLAALSLSTNICPQRPAASARIAYEQPIALRRQIAEALQIGLMLVVTRRQLEQARGGAADDVVLGLLGEERQVPDGRRQIEIP